MSSSSRAPTPATGTSIPRGPIVLTRPTAPTTPQVSTAPRDKIKVPIGKLEYFLFQRDLYIIANYEAFGLNFLVIFFTLLYLKGKVYNYFTKNFKDYTENINDISQIEDEINEMFYTKGVFDKKLDKLYGDYRKALNAERELIALK